MSLLESLARYLASNVNMFAPSQSQRPNMTPTPSVT